MNAILKRHTPLARPTDPLRLRAPLHDGESEVVAAARALIARIEAGEDHAEEDFRYRRALAEISLDLRVRVIEWIL